MLSPLTQQLVQSLSRLPGIGPKSAQRICFQLLKKKQHHTALGLADALKQAIDHIDLCESCRQFSESPQCPMCADDKRDASCVCVVESPADVVAIEHSHGFKGFYFVLHGHLSPIDGIGPADLAIDQLVSRCRAADIEELILATGATMEGEATAHYISQQLEGVGIRMTRIAHGVPMGGELEYLDGNTLAHALRQRQIIFNPKSEKINE